MATTADALKVTIDPHEYHLSAAEEQKCMEALDGLAKQVAQFPFADLRIYVEGARSNEVIVKLTLNLPGTSLAVDDHDLVLPPAFDRCLDSLLARLEEYKDRLGRVPERQKLQKGTHQDVHPTILLDVDALHSAIDAGDYAAFRAAALPIEEEVRMRIGRWVQRYPTIDQQIGERLDIADILEEVFLMAFDEYSNRPQEVPFGAWLEQLIDPALKSLARNPDAEMENISLVRTARDAVEGQEPAV